MNTIASPTLQYESVIYVFSLTLEPDVQSIVSIEKCDNAYNGHSSLYDAFIELIPEQVKAQTNDAHIQRLYQEVRYTMCVTHEQSIRLTTGTSRPCSSSAFLPSPHIRGRSLRWV